MRPLLIVGLMLSIVQTGFSRFAEDFDFVKMMERPDLVVVMEHISTVGSGKKDEERGGLGLLTKAKVLTVLKGKEGSGEIAIRHFLYGSGTPNNAPNEARFPLRERMPLILKSDGGNATAFVYPPCQYLAFLKRTAEGVLIPASDQFDSNLSFRLLADSSALFRLYEEKSEEDGSTKRYDELLRKSLAEQDETGD